MNVNGKRPKRTAVVVDPHPYSHGAIASLLRGLHVSVAAATTSASEALPLVLEHRPTLLLLEIDLPEGCGAAIDLIRDAKAQVPAIVPVVFTHREETHLADDAFEAGAVSFVSKRSEVEDVRAFIRQAFRSSIYVPGAATAEGLPNGVGAPSLTQRETEILRYVAEGMSNREVARLLWVTDQTVKFHLGNAYRKLGVGNRFEAVERARVYGLLREPHEHLELPAPRNGASDGMAYEPAFPA